MVRLSSHQDEICLINNLLSRAALLGTSCRFYSQVVSQRDMSLIEIQGVCLQELLAVTAQHQEDGGVQLGWEGKKKNKAKQKKTGEVKTSPTECRAGVLYCLTALSNLKITWRGLYHRQSELIHDGPFLWLPRACHQDDGILAPAHSAPTLGWSSLQSPSAAIIPLEICGKCHILYVLVFHPHIKVAPPPPPLETREMSQRVEGSQDGPLWHSRQGPLPIVVASHRQVCGGIIGVPLAINLG